MIQIWQQSASDLVGKKALFDSVESTIHAFLVKSAVVGVGLCSAFCYLLNRSSLLHSIIILLMSILALDLIRQTLSNRSSLTSTLTSSPISPQKEPTQQPSLSNVATKKSSSSERNPLLWMIHGVSYDLQEFLERHPGGRESILLGRGRDCTALFESYHAFSHQQRNVLEKYRRQQASAMLSKEEPRKHDFFYEVLQERATAVLKEKGVDPVTHRGATPLRAAYYILVFSCWIMAGYSHLKGSVSGSFLFAIFGWLMGALGHDAGHFAVSRSPFLNEWGVWSMSMICNPILWQHQHTYGHHSFTNDFDHDPDLHHFEVLLRVHKKFPHESHYQRQSNFAYVIFAYFFVVFGTAIWIPWGMIQSGTLYGIVEWQDKERPTKALGMRLHLVLYVVLIMMVPFWTHTSIWTAAMAVYVHIATLGLVFALFSQINHLNEASIERGVDNASEYASDPRVVGSWAADQVETSNNFCSQSSLWHILSNGLNHQIEHHLFPGLNHCHLYLIAPVVQQTCEEFGVNYKSYETWSEVLGATLEWFEKLSVDDEKVQAPEAISS